jgi:NADH-quinone oxidoreductase subunit M
VGLPGLCGFIGEFMVLLGTFTAGKSWAGTGLEGFFPMPKLVGAISATAVILAAMYLLTMYQKIFFGPLDKPENRDPHVRDVHGRETWVFGIVVAAALFMGVFPQTFLSRSEKSVDAFVKGYHDRLEEARRAPDAPSHIYPALPEVATEVAPKAPTAGAGGPP